MHNYNVKGIFTVQKIYIHMYIHVIKQYTPHDNDMVTWAKAEVFVPGVCVHLSAHFPMDVQTETQLRTNTGGGGGLKQVTKRDTALHWLIEIRLWSQSKELEAKFHFSFVGGLRALSLFTSAAVHIVLHPKLNPAPHLFAQNVRATCSLKVMERYT